MTTMFESAKEQYAKLGIDVEAAMDKLAQKAISVHCWQGDDVLGFDQEGGLSGGIQTTKAAFRAASKPPATTLVARATSKS